MKDNKPNEEIRDTNKRRTFLKYLGVSSAGIAIVNAAQVAKQKSIDGFEITRAEIEKLKDDYEKLDRKTQIILRLTLILTGLDIFI
jgi:hypothetical protein